jgi:hypothetical protein
MESAQGTKRSREKAALEQLPPGVSLAKLRRSVNAVLQEAPADADLSAKDVRGKVEQMCGLDAGALKPVRKWLTEVTQEAFGGCEAGERRAPAEEAPKSGGSVLPPGMSMGQLRGAIGAAIEQLAPADAGGKRTPAPTQAVVSKVEAACALEAGALAPASKLVAAMVNGAVKRAEQARAAGPDKEAPARERQAKALLFRRTGSEEEDCAEEKRPASRMYKPRGRLLEHLDLKNREAVQLAKRGAVVVTCCTRERAAELREEVQKDFEALGTGIDFSDPATWTNEKWPQHTHGLNQNQGLGLMRGACIARINTVKAWQALGFERPLLSFDAVTVSRPATQDRLVADQKRAAVPEVPSWLHIDQAPSNEHALDCVQGALALNDQKGGTQRTFMILPPKGESAQGFRDRFLAAFPAEGRKLPHAHFHTLDDDEKRWLLANGEPWWPELEAGQLLIWDSCIAHASQPGEGEKRMRFSTFVSAKPVELATKEELAVRRDMLEKGVVSCHNPVRQGKKRLLANGFEDTGRTYGKAMPAFQKRRLVRGIKRAGTAPAGQPVDKLAKYMAKHCAGYGLGCA